MKNKFIIPSNKFPGFKSERMILFTLLTFIILTIMYRQKVKKDMTC